MLECYVYEFLIFLMRAEAWLAGFELYAAKAVLGAAL
jgi:hypothetical protein